MHNVVVVTILCYSRSKEAYVTPIERRVNDTHTHACMCVVYTGAFLLIYLISSGEIYNATNWCPSASRDAESCNCKNIRGQTTFGACILPSLMLFSLQVPAVPSSVAHCTIMLLWMQVLLDLDQAIRNPFIPYAKVSLLAGCKAHNVLKSGATNVPTEIGCWDAFHLCRL